MSLFIILTVIQAIVAAALVGVVLMQRSEGGGLGIGGNPSGALGARGAADFLTRSTRWLAVAFVGLSIVLAAFAVAESRVEVSSDLDRDVSVPGAGDLLGEPAGGPAEASAGTAPAGSAATADDLLGEPAGAVEAPAAAGEDPRAE
ncbi:preprotein translocase subunit SecG [Qipengyuania sp. ASV99]|uniref:preprotein translocase subunit SecG n=1 Tax=Qipengyuania sp. ASV99 TaxID=3399681 RepID=UPI003A4C783A